METTDDAPAFAPASLLCLRARPSVLLATSRDAGWTCVLLEQHRVHPVEDPFETRRTPDQTVVVQTRGEQELECLHGTVWRRALYRAGTVGLTPGGSIDRLRRPRPARGGAATSSEKVNLYIPQCFFRDAAEHQRRAGQRSPEQPPDALAFHDPLVAQTVAALLRAMRAGAPDLYAQSAMQWLATHLLAAHAGWPEADAADRRDPGLLADRRLARVMEYMEAHMAEPLTLERLAAEAGVSKFHFARLFRGATGATPHAYLVQLRMDAARRLLAASDLPVAEVAARCGFAQSAHFSTAFARRFGAPPTAFRHQLRR